MAVMKCKMCGGTLEIVPDSSVAQCEYCCSMQTLPKITDERLASFYERANDLRMSHEFDKAVEIYERIIEEAPDDADAYWSMVLCRYGVEYVEESRGGIRKPTINRAQLESVTEDVNYRSALKYADAQQKKIYEEEAARIDQILQRYMEISRNEPPYDVFICYKETDFDGRRTVDSVRAGEIYRELTAEGFKVFFAPVTLENKLGEDYEPYIFAAINSAKVMVVIGTKAEYMNAVWVKNEWSRFLALAKKDTKKTLIPVYGGMDPYDMPEAFRFKQSQSMEKLGFMLDLVRGIEKLVGKSNGANVTNADQAAPAANVDTLLQRVAIFLDDQDWRNANIYCEKVLDVMPTNGMAYVYKLLAEAKVSGVEALLGCTNALDQFRSYKNAVRFADEDTSGRLIDINNALKERLLRETEIRLEEERIQREQKLAESERIKEQIRQREDCRNKKQALLQARSNASELLASQTQEKQDVEKRLLDCTRKLNDLRASKRAVCVPAVIILVNTIALLNNITSSGFEGPYMVFLVLQCVLAGVLAGKREKSKVAAVVLTFITLGFAAPVSAIIGMIGSLSNSPKMLNKEKTTLEAVRVQLDNALDITRKSLGELNSKLAVLEKEMKEA